MNTKVWIPLLPHNAPYGPHRARPKGGTVRGGSRRDLLSLPHSHFLGKKRAVYDAVAYTISSVTFFPFDISYFKATSL